MAAQWQVGDRIENRWEIRKILGGPGKSGMGIVYVLHDLKSLEWFAAKTFQVDRPVRKAQTAERFIQEAHTWINLDIHPNVTQAHFVYKVEDWPYLFLEYVSGGDLSGWIGTPQLTEDMPQVLRFAIQFCDGMTHVLSKGIKAHRDIKPQNCLVTQNKMLKVTDFGLAKVFDDTPAEEAHADSPVGGLAIHLSETGKSAGTCTHMAPEQFADAKHVDVRADIYSFGVMLFQMVTGRLPFVGRKEDFARLHSSVPPPPLQSGQSSLDSIVRKCLEKTAAERYEEFGTLRRELATIYESLTGLPAPKPTFDRKLEVYELLNKGFSLGRLERHEEALVWYNRAVAINPRYAEAWCSKGAALLTLGRHEEALACYDQALGINSQDAEAWSKKGNALGSLGRHEEALACYDRALAVKSEEAKILGDALSSSPGSSGSCEVNLTRDRAMSAVKAEESRTWSSKGDVLSGMGCHEEALACFETALALRRGNPAAWYGKGVLLASLNRPKEALECFEAAFCFDYQFREACLYNKAVLLTKLERIQQAIDCFQEAKRLGHPKAAEALALCRNRFGGQGPVARVEEILAGHNRFRDLKIEDERAVHKRRMLVRTLGRHEEALASYDRAIALNPDDWKPWYDKGKVLAGLQRNDEKVACYVRALACCDRALGVNPEFAEAWHGKGTVLWYLGRREESLACYDRALAINPEYAEAWGDKGNVLGLLRRSGEALACFDRALAIKPEYAEAWEAKAEALEYVGRREESLACYEHALAIDPQLAVAWHNKGNALTNLGHHEEALACYERAIAIDPEYAEAWYGKGTLLTEKLRRPREGIRCLKEAERLGLPAMDMVIEMYRKDFDV